jgi:hypothetical protein
MSRGEVNARRSTVTLHLVSSLDGIIAKKDNQCFVAEQLWRRLRKRGFCRLFCTRCSHIRACAPTRLAIWRHSDRRDHKQRAAVHEEER